MEPRQHPDRRFLWWQRRMAYRRIEVHAIDAALRVLEPDDDDLRTRITLWRRRRRSVSASSLWRVTKCDVGAAPNLLLGRNEELDVAPNRLRERRQELIKAPCVLFRRRPDQSSRVPCCMRGDWPRRRSLWRDRGQLHAKVSASAMTCSKIGRFMRRGHCTMACLGCQTVCAVAAGASGALCAPSSGNQLCAPSTGPRGARRPLTLTLTRAPGSPSGPTSIYIPRAD